MIASSWETPVPNRYGVITALFTPAELQEHLNKCSTAGLNVISVAIGDVSAGVIDKKMQMPCVIVTENIYG